MIEPNTGEVLEQAQAQTQTLEELGKVKRMLEFREANNLSCYANDWYTLAMQYAAINARANEGYCMARYKHYLPTQEEAPRYAWQEVHDK